MSAAPEQQPPARPFPSSYEISSTSNSSTAGDGSTVTARRQAPREPQGAAAATSAPTEGREAARDFSGALVDPLQRLTVRLVDDCAAASEGGASSLWEGELLQLLQEGGFSAQLSALTAVLQETRRRPNPYQQPSGGGSHPVRQEALLCTLLAETAGLPHAPSLLCQALDASGSGAQSLLPSQLPPEQRLLVTLALLESGDLKRVPEGLKFLPECCQLLRRQPIPLQLDPQLSARLLFQLHRHAPHLPSADEAATAAVGSLSACPPQRLLSLLPLLGHWDLGLAETVVDSASLPSTMAPPEANLAGVVEELGPPCTSSKASFLAILRQFPTLDEAAVGQLMAVMCSSAGGPPSPNDPYGVHALFSAALGKEGAAADSSAAVDPASAADTYYKVDVAVEALVEAAPGLDWKVVARRLGDSDTFLLKDVRGFVSLVAGVKRGLGGVAPFPLEAVLSPAASGRLWANPAGQLSFLAHAAAAPPEVLTFESHGRCAPPLEGLHAGKSPVGTPNHAWLSLDLLETLGRLAEAGLQPGVRAVLEHPLKHCPEVLLAGLAGCRAEAAGALRSEVSAALLPAYVASNPNSSAVLHRVWPLNREAVLAAMAVLYSQDPTAMSRVLDVCGELKALTEVLGSMPFPFSLELAALAARREYLNLEKWLQDRLSSFGLPFVTAVLDFLDDKNKAGAGVGADGQPLGVSKIQLSPEVQALFFHFLSANSSALPLDAQEALKRVLAAAEVGGGGGVPPPSSAATEGFATDIEEEANSYFQKIYGQQTSIEEMVAMLKRFKSSTVQREQEIFACMIHNLFDEYRFFPKYPEKELQITAKLFGALVHHALVSSITLGLALRYVLDALRKPLGSKMFSFGLEALNQFRSSLGQWTQYCQHILQISHLHQSHPELCAFIEKQISEGVPQSNADQAGDLDMAKGDSLPAVDSAAAETRLSSNDTHTVASLMGNSADILTEPAPLKPAAVATGGGGTPVSVEMPTEPTLTTTSSGGVASSPAGAAATLPSISHLSGSLAGGSSLAPSFASTINAETLEQAAEQWNDFPVPEEALQDKLHFLINNVSKMNMTAKAKEVKAAVPEEFMPWFANYMVVKRAAQEPNFHEMYLNLFEELGNPKLILLTVRTTHHYVKILLASERIKTDSGERSLLKNLGSFLGQLTIAKNKPVLQKDLDVKAIVIDSFQKGKMIAVIPFVHKVLEACNASKIFKPPNPWLMGIMSLLAEIYGMEKLKLNLKFELEMLFKDLNLQIHDVTPSDLLRGKERELGPGNPDFSVDKSALLARESAAAATEAARATVPGASAAEGAAKPLGVMDSAITAAMPSAAGGDQQMHLNAYVVINSNLQMVAERLQLRRVVPVAVDRAICEIITPVVERSVTIACMTTQELILKDFAMEPDENRMRTAAHQMVSSLAGSLALVTCKEPLRVSLSNQLRQLLSPSCPEQSLLEQTMTIVSQDNLDLGCTIIEKAATDKAVRDIDERLLPVYQMRQKAKQAGQPFYDPNIESRIPATLPEALRPRPGHLNPQQQRVYDDFARVPRAASLPQGLAGAGPRAMTSSILGGYDGDQADSGSQTDGGSIAAGVLTEKYGAWQQHLDEFTMKDPAGLFGAQPEGSEGRQLMAELADMCRKTAGREDLSLALGQRLFRALISGQQTRMHITAYVTALEVLREAAGFRQLPLKITQWYTHLEEERRWGRPGTEALIRAHLLHLPDFDAYLAKSLSAVPFGPASELAVHLIRTCILAKEPIVTAAELYNTLDVLNKIATRSGGAALVALIEQAKQVGPGRLARDPNGRPTKPPMSKVDNEPLGLREQVAALFDEWARLLDSNIGDRLHSNYVSQLHQAGLLKGDEHTDRFLRILTELAVSHCVASETPVGMGRPGNLSFVAVDALVRLLTCLSQGHGLGQTLLAKALVVITAVLQGDADERGGAFNSRPYFRLFVGLICELSPSDVSDPNNFSYLATIVAALNALQPLRVPGFAFSWLELVSHRQFMPKLLISSNTKVRNSFHRLLVALLRFLEPYLRNAQLTESVRLLYRGTLRVLLVLLHDFPEFLCEYHFLLCDVIPPSCIQMRNLILSAFPRNMRLPDPFTPNLKVDLLPEITQAPRIVPDEGSLLPAQLKGEVDAYLKARHPMSFLAELRSRLLLPPQEQAAFGTRYNAPLINALVLYVGIQAIAAKAGQPGSSPVMHSPAMDVFQRLAADLDTEGRYLLLNAVANQLRYPNNHTHYFSCVLLYLFSEAGQEIVQEQITRVLLERLIVNRPHPWGLLITFIELIKNPRYNFWSHSFTRCAQEIEKLFESVARSCMGPPPKPEDELLMKQQDAAARG